MTTVRAALDTILRGYEPNPAVLVDRQWNVVALNTGAAVLTAGVTADLMTPPINALRLTLSPGGMAPRILNFAEWSAHLMIRLRRQVLASGDSDMADLYDELVGLPGVMTEHPQAGVEGPLSLAIPLRLHSDLGELTFVSTMSTFGTPLDVTLAELTMEAFLPADPATALALQAARTMPVGPDDERSP